MVKLILLFQKQFRLNNLALTVLFSFCSILLTSQTIIKGTATDYAEKRITILRTIDQLSDTQEVLGFCETDENGDFEISFNLVKTELIEIICNRNVGTLVVEPNGNYDITFHQPDPGTVQKFYKTPVAISFNQETDLLNQNLDEFIIMYHNFIDTNAFYLYLKLSSGNAYQNSRKDKLVSAGIGRHASDNEEKDKNRIGEFLFEIEKFKEEVGTKFGSYTFRNEFFGDYVRASIAILEMSGGQERSFIYKNEILNIDLTHPMQVSLFNSFYGDLFYQKTKIKGPNVIDVVNNCPSYNTLDSLISDMDFLDQPYLRKTSILFQIKERFYDRGSNPGCMMRILKELKMDEDSLISLMSTNLIDKINRGKKGTTAENFKLVDIKSNFVELSDFEGKFVYLGFYAEWCRNCTEELKLLENLKREYGNSIEFISISMDDDYQDFKDHLLDNRNQDWTFLFGAGDPMILEKYNVRTLPTYFLIDPDGNIYEDYTKTPSEGIDQDFSRMMIDLKKGKSDKKYKVWDD